MDLEQIKKIAGIIESVPQSKKSSSILSESMMKIAGLPLFEAEDDDDAETDEEYNARMKRRAEKLGVPFKPRNSESKKTEEKPEPKKEKAPKQTDLFADEKSDAPKKRGKAPNANSKSGVLRTWIENHPGVTRAEAWKHAVEQFGEKSDDNPGGITKSGFSTLYQNARSHHGLVKKKEVKESWLILHPTVSGHVLHENRELNQFQWVHFLNENQDPMIFESEEAAEEVARYLRDFRNQSVVIEHVILD